LTAKGIADQGNSNDTGEWLFIHPYRLMASAHHLLEAELSFASIAKPLRKKVWQSTRKKGFAL
jgi:hypothetical protein